MHTGVPAIDDSQARFVLGTDEAGYGAYAGRLYIGGTVVPREWKGLKGLTDSKDLTHKEREKLAFDFRKLIDGKGVNPYLACVVFAEHSEIDSEGVWNTLHRLHRACIKTLRDTAKELWGVEPLIVVDGTLKLGDVGAISLPKADLLVPAVSMASVLAKVDRDATMVEAEKLYPGFDFAGNKGYGGAPKHQAGLDKLGPCPIHRRSYAPIARLLGLTVKSSKAAAAPSDGPDTSIDTFMSFFDD